MVTPSASDSCSVYLLKLLVPESKDLNNTVIPDKALVPNTLAMIPERSTSDSFKASIRSFIFTRISFKGRILPVTSSSIFTPISDIAADTSPDTTAISPNSLSTSLKPSISVSFARLFLTILVGLAKRTIAIRKAVPELVLLIAESAMIPVAAATDSILCPKAVANGAENFIDSYICSKLVLAVA